MLVSWNVRGLNKSGKLREISFRLLTLKPEIIVLIETRVKLPKANSARNNLKMQRKFIDNYSHHENGRIWIN
ncbi:unnamed protein product [Lathyrus sativus]|nr:unnamed protein product [Lathyrus sativus]